MQGIKRAPEAAWEVHSVSARGEAATAIRRLLQASYKKFIANVSQGLSLRAAFKNVAS